MAASVSRNFVRLDTIKLTDAALMREVGLMVRERIVRRTRQGQDTDGQPFRPYSPGYAKAKSEELGSGPVNLTVSGGMLNAITLVKVTDTEVELGFSS